MMPLTRRRFVGYALSATAAGLPAFVFRPTAAHSAARIASVPLTGKLKVFTGAGANVVALRGPEGLLLIDGGLAEHSSALLRAVTSELATRRIHTLINTHWHPAQTGANGRLGKQGAQIIAHENTKLWLARKINVSWRETPYGPLPEEALPVQTTYDDGKLDFGDERVEYGYLPQAHTNGDLYVLLRKANVLVAGDAVSGAGWPLIDWQTGGWIGGMAAGFSKLIALCNDATRIIPAQGPVLALNDLKQQREMYRTIYQRLVKSLTSGLGPEEVVASAPTQEFNPHWGDPSAFIDMAFRSLWPHFAPNA